MLRWPNALERWTPRMYDALGDPEPRVRVTALMALSHLLGNEMMKAKGHMSRVCLCLLDADPQVRRTLANPNRTPLF